MPTYLRDNTLIAVPLDKGVGFCVIKKSTYAEELEKAVDCEQVRKLEKSCDYIVMKNQKKSFGYDKKKEETARFFRLAEVHKKESPLRPVLYIPGSCYHKLNKFLNPFFQKIEGANIETSTNDAR